jgi:excisionase family DNA binding protein
VITAEKVYREILEMPVKERERLFLVIARQGFEKALYTHDEVFEDLGEPFTIKEAAEYLDVAEITVRRWVIEGSLKSRRIGRSIVFDPDTLRGFKKARKAITKLRNTPGYRQ